MVARNLATICAVILKFYVHGSKFVVAVILAVILAVFMCTYHAHKFIFNVSLVTTDVQGTFLLLDPLAIYVLQVLLTSRGEWLVTCSFNSY